MASKGSHAAQCRAGSWSTSPVLETHIFPLLSSRTMANAVRNDAAAAALKVMKKCAKICTACCYGTNLSQTDDDQDFAVAAAEAAELPKLMKPPAPLERNCNYEPCPCAAAAAGAPAAHAAALAASTPITMSCICMASHTLADSSPRACCFRAQTAQRSLLHQQYRDGHQIDGHNVNSDLHASATSGSKIGPVSAISLDGHYDQQALLLISEFGENNLNGFSTSATSSTATALRGSLHTRGCSSKHGRPGSAPVLIDANNSSTSSSSSAFQQLPAQVGGCTTTEANVTGLSEPEKEALANQLICPSCHDVLLVAHTLSCSHTCEYPLTSDSLMQTLTLVY